MKAKLFIPLLIVAILLAAGAWGYSLYHQKQVEQAISRKIFITPMKGEPAKDFTLIDQRGKKVSLHDFQGKAVLLQFLDPKCEDVCPIVSQEMILADKELGKHNKDVVYLGVNVNEYHNTQDDILDYSKEHGLDKLANWHFLTGTPDELKAVWKLYGIDVIPSKDGDVQHSTDMYFIDKDGNKRYVSYPNQEQSIADWGKGISYFLQKLV